MDFISFHLKNYLVHGQHITQFSLFLIITSILFAVFFSFKKTIQHVSKKNKKHSKITQIIYKFSISIKYSFIFILSAKIATNFAIAPKIIEKAISTLFMIGLVLEIMLFIQNTILFTLSKFIANNNDEETTSSSKRAISIIVKIVIWTIAAMLILSNLGFEVSTLVASLGISSIAIAFALQSILADIFSSFSIFIDKPFVENDWIKIDEETSGTIKHIGIKSTRIESVNGEEIVISNHELNTKRIYNYANIKKRRVLFSLCVPHSTSVKKLEQIPASLKSIITKTKKTEFKRSHLKEIGQYGHIFETDYYILESDLVKYMDIREKINYMIIENFAKNKIKLEYPTTHFVK